MSAQCATEGCTNPAAWYSIREGNKWGNQAPRRCTACCDAIAELDIPAGGLRHVDQITAARRDES